MLLLTVEIEEPRWRNRRGRISDLKQVSLSKFGGRRACLRIDPYGGLETNGESSLKDKEHSCGTNACGCGNSRGMLDLINQSGLDNHDGRHNADHGKKLTRVSSRSDGVCGRVSPKAGGRRDQSGTKG